MLGRIVQVRDEHGERDVVEHRHQAAHAQIQLMVAQRLKNCSVLLNYVQRDSPRETMSSHSFSVFLTSSHPPYHCIWLEHIEER